MSGLKLHSQPWRQPGGGLQRCRQVHDLSPCPCLLQPSQKAFRIKVKLAKKAKQNRPIPPWIRFRTNNTIRCAAARLPAHCPPHSHCDCWPVLCAAAATGRSNNRSLF